MHHFRVNLLALKTLLILLYLSSACNSLEIQNGNCGLDSLPQKLYVGYFQSWSEIWSSTGTDTGLANLPAYVNVVNLAFILPDCQYQGELSLNGTGLNFASEGSVVKTSIQTLKSRNPNTKVLVSIGGASYTNWANLNEQAILRFVQDFGLDGVDIDYEPSNPDCTSTDGQVSCKTDEELINVVSRIRAAFPQPYLVTLASWSIGAYGQGAYIDAQPQGSYTGFAVNLLRSSVSENLDWINIIGYDAGDTFDPIQALLAYQSLFSGCLVLGVEVPPEAYGGHVLSISELENLCESVIENNGAGMMIWSLHKIPDGTASDDNPNAQMISDTICDIFELEGCGAPLFSNES